MCFIWFRRIWLRIFGNCSKHYHPILKQRESVSYFAESTSSVWFRKENSKEFVKSSLQFYEMFNNTKFDQNRTKCEENTRKN